MTRKEGYADENGVSTPKNVFNFLIIAFSIFLMVKAMNNLKKKEDAIPAPPPEPTKTEVLLEEIKEILKRK